MGSASRNKGKRHRRASSGGGNPSSTRTLKGAGAICRAKGKRRQMARSQDADAATSERISDKSPQEGLNQEVEPRTLTGGPVQHFADDMRFSLKAQMSL